MTAEGAEHAPEEEVVHMDEEQCRTVEKRMTMMVVGSTVYEDTQAERHMRSAAEYMSSIQQQKVQEDLVPLQRHSEVWGDPAMEGQEQSLSAMASSEPL